MLLVFIWFWHSRALLCAFVFALQTPFPLVDALYGVPFAFVFQVFHYHLGLF